MVYDSELRDNDDAHLVVARGILSSPLGMRTHQNKRLSGHSDFVIMPMISLNLADIGLTHFIEGFTNGISAKAAGIW